MGSFYRKQEEIRLTLTTGDWLLVRKHQTAGEQRAAHARLYKAGTLTVGQKPEIDLEQTGVAEVVSYLIDWSITDKDDKPIPIRDQPYEFVAAALAAMTPEGLKEIIALVDAHDRAMAAEREREKKVPDGKSAPAPTSTSVA